VKEMTEEPGTYHGRYIYAVIADTSQRIFGSFGIDGEPVYTITNGVVAVVVSNVPNKKIRPERRHLGAHQEVLKQLMAENTPLPMRFGVIADSADAVMSILEKNQYILREQLREMGDKVEFGLRVNWDVPNIFDYFIRTHDELRMLRDDMFRGAREPSLDDRIELGRLFERIITQDRETLTAEVEEALNGCCHQIKRNDCRSEREVMHLACLVGRQDQARFETEVFAAAQLFDNNFTFDYNGPWPPHNFVEVVLDL